VKVHILVSQIVYNNKRMWVHFDIYSIVNINLICTHFLLNFVNILGSQKCALSLDVPQTWFNNWPEDDSLSRNMSSL
jgi:hypothetical protein